MTKEKVIFRRQKPHEFHMKGADYFLAAFPEELCNAGRVACLPFCVPYNTNHAVFEPFCEVSLDYYYNRTTIIHKNEMAAQACLEAVQDYYGTEFAVVEKLRSGRRGV